MIRRQHIVGDFFDEAEEMRGTLDACFRDTYAAKIDWHYFCDPGMYAYLRTAPQTVFPQELFQQFMSRLRSWCMENLGLTPVGLPYLHLMVNGCRLGLHSDFHNGVWGYVYSLTRWDNRGFSGGETLLMRDGVPSYKKHHVHGEVLYELIPARFNQLLIFDDRIVHATPTIEGSMNPLDGRIAMVGHIRATSPEIISGTIQSADARRIVLEALHQIRDEIRNYRDVQGTVTYRIEIAAAGNVESVSILTDNVVTQSTGYSRSDSVETVKSLIYRRLVGLRFHTAESKSVIVVPLLIPIPDLSPITLAVSHRLSRDAIRERGAAFLGKGEELELHGHWDGEMFVVTDPIAGYVQIEADQITLSFDPPMWVPSQRETFEMTVAAWAREFAGVGMAG